MSLTIGVLGGGSFGTALANVLADNGHGVTIWARKAEQVEAINQRHENTRYLPGIPLNPQVKASTDLAQTLSQAQLVVGAIPTQHTRGVLEAARPHLLADARVVSASKGIELGSHAMLSEIFESLLPDHHTGYLSGPSFAKELITRHPTAATVAAKDESLSAFIQTAFKNPYLRVYTSTDVVGVEVAGAVKNIMAIASGISDALGFGLNTRAALITRGLAEITRLGLFLGAERSTFMGLSGMGDLVLTCTGDLSRNRRVGLGIGAGKDLDTLLQEMGQVAEGVYTTKAVYNYSRKLGVEMPIVEQVYLALYEGKNPKQAVVDLMARPVKGELA